ncbi:MAG: hypothetical protein D6714_14840 [Bacteroidetes bacterium]|nr:MAG: hypothetical protein D6714_14840 [Bacteroidota bacterium]
MDVLKDIIRIITRNKVKRIEIIGQPGTRKSQTHQLYEGICEGKIERDEDIARVFFGEGDNAQIYATRLKRQLYKRLINTIFFIDVNQPGFNEYQRAYYNLYKNYAAIRVLIGRGSRTAAMDLIKKTLRKAVKYEMTELVVSLARELRMQYGIAEGNRKKFEEYRDLGKKYREILEVEIEVEEMYIDLVIHFVSSKSPQKHLLSAAETYRKRIEPLLPLYNSYWFKLYAYLTLSIRYEIGNDHHNALRISQEAIDFFESRPHLASKSAIGHFHLKMLSFYTSTKQYDKGEASAQKGLETFHAGTSSWFLILANTITLFFHSKQFSRAFSTFIQASTHPAFKSIPQEHRENWLLIEAFIHYLISIGKIDPAGVEGADQLKKFRYSRFINEVVVYSKDKRGYNITFLILQILFLLQQKKYDQVIDRTESINMYCHRYLRQDETLRSNCFIKMLMTLPAARFNRTAAIRRTQKLAEKLKSVPIEKASQSSELEIIPYETLWEFVLESLDHNFR